MIKKAADELADLFLKQSPTPSTIRDWLANVCLNMFGSFAQTENQSQEPKYRIEVDTSLYEVRVTDNDGQTITDLSKEQFQVLEGNAPLPIVFFEELPSRPLSLAILLDVGSGMAEDNVKHGKQIIFDLIHLLSSDDEILIGLFVNYRKKPPIWLNPNPKAKCVEVLSDLTSDRYELSRVIENIPVGGRPKRWKIWCFFS